MYSQSTTKCRIVVLNFYSCFPINYNTGFIEKGGESFEERALTQSKPCCLSVKYVLVCQLRYSVTGET